MHQKFVLEDGHIYIEREREKIEKEGERERVRARAGTECAPFKCLDLTQLQRQHG